MAKSLSSFILVLGICLAAAGTGLYYLGSRSVPLNEEVLATIAEYPMDGTYQVLPKHLIAKNYGVTRDIYYLGQKRMDGDIKKRSYCSGITFEVYMGALEKRLGKNHHLLGKEGQFSEFRRNWYGTDGNRLTMVNALTSRGIGLQVTPSEALPGDFVQFWRNSGGGHSAVLLDVEFGENHQPAALVFWSVHNANGISQKRETIGTAQADIKADEIHIVRALAPEPFF